MPGENRLEILIKEMAPVLGSTEYVFVSLPGEICDYAHLEPQAAIREKEGLSLILTRETAGVNRLDCSEVFREITLEVHSDLHAVGLTAAVSAKLASAGISANVVAGFYHDHIFVQGYLATKALAVLVEMSG